MKDPNPLVGGKGFRELKRAGIKVRVGLLEQECRTLNEAFVKYITRQLPFVTLKLAASLDGKIATVTGRRALDQQRGFPSHGSRAAE